MANPLVTHAPNEAHSGARRPRRAEAERRAVLQTELDQQRARLVEMERRLAQELRENAEVRAEEDRLRQEWAARCATQLGAPADVAAS